MKERSKENATLPLPSGSREYVGKRIQLRTILKLALLGVIVYTTIFKSVLLRIGSRLAIHRTGRTNVIFMISDGYGPASASLGRSFLQVVQNSTDANAKYMTPLDHILVGTHRSRSSNSLVTDSAAGATAFACGLKTNNYAIGVDERGASCGTVLEGAKSKGFLTGIVVTTRITDATPGSYFAHVPSRGLESEIANEVFGYDGKGKKYRETPLDLAFGGGGCFFLPQAHPLSCRQDDHDLLQVAREQGWNIDVLFDTQSTEDPMENAIVSSSHALPFSPAQSFSTTINLTQADSFRKNKTPLPHLSLLTPSNTPFVIDRPDSIPGLPDLAVKALDALDSSSKNKKGFFIMIEGSQIDLCSHLNDPACHAREIEEYQKTIDRVLDWVESSNKRGDRTLLVSTSDHETGGLALARQLTSEPCELAFSSHVYSDKFRLWMAPRAPCICEAFCTSSRVRFGHTKANPRRAAT